MPQVRVSVRKLASSTKKLRIVPLTDLQWAIILTLRGNPYLDIYDGHTYNYRLVGNERAAGNRMVKRGLLRIADDTYVPTALGNRSFEAYQAQSQAQSQAKPQS